MTLNHLTDREFEELTYELLKSLGFANLSWRRGSGLAGASADQGRDITAKRLEEDVDGHKRLDDWFIQCKQHARGVPPEKLHGAIAWASAERPAVLLIVVSNFLSNAAKVWLGQFESQNKPPFRIKIWELKDLEGFLVSRPALSMRFRITLTAPLNGMHPAHESYVRRPSQNTLTYFLRAIDEIEPGLRETLFAWGYWHVINPAFKASASGQETLATLAEPKITYENFVAKCLRLGRDRTISGSFLVSSLVIEALRWSQHAADPVEAARAHQISLDTIALWEDELKTATDDNVTERLQQMIGFTRRMMRTDIQVREAGDRYRYLCETLLPVLFLEEASRSPLRTSGGDDLERGATPNIPD